MARQAPLESSGYSANEVFAACIISSNSTARLFGMPWPPYSGLPDKAVQPFSANVLNASLKPFGVVTTPSFHWQPSSSPLLLSGNIRPSVILPASSRMASARSRVTSAVAGIAAQTFSASKTSCSTKRISSSGALYVAMVLSRCGIYGMEFFKQQCPPDGGHCCVALHQAESEREVFCVQLHQALQAAFERQLVADGARQQALE